MIVLHKGLRLIHFPVEFDKSLIKQEIDLLPGLNEVSAAVVKQMQEHPTMKHLFESDELEIIEEAGKPVESLKAIKAVKAIKMIAETARIELLQKWLDSETRSDVKKALQAQIAEIEAPNSTKAQ